MNILCSTTNYWCVCVFVCVYGYVVQDVGRRVWAEGKYVLPATAICIGFQLILVLFSTQKTDTRLGIGEKWN